MKTKETARYNYGECSTCGGTLEERRVAQDFWIHGSLVVVENVPAGVCSRCGEKIVRAEVGLRLDAIMRDAQKIKKAPKISVPVIKFEKSAA